MTIREMRLEDGEAASFFRPSEAGNPTIWLPNGVGAIEFSCGGAPPRRDAGHIDAMV
jgi:hypothetical protein